MLHWNFVVTVERYRSRCWHCCCQSGESPHSNSSQHLPRCHGRLCGLGQPTVKLGVCSSRVNLLYVIPQLHSTQSFRPLGKRPPPFCKGSLAVSRHQFRLFPGSIPGTRIAFNLVFCFPGANRARARMLGNDCHGSCGSKRIAVKPTNRCSLNANHDSAEQCCSAMSGPKNANLEQILWHAT